MKTAVTNIATALRGEPQRRNASFLVDEQLKLSPDAGRCNDYLAPATKQMVRATQLPNVNVHTVDPNGLKTMNVHAGDDFQAGRPFSEAAAEAAFFLYHADIASVLRRTAGSPRTT